MRDLNLKIIEKFTKTEGGEVNGSSRNLDKKFFQYRQ